MPRNPGSDEANARTELLTPRAPGERSPRATAAGVSDRYELDELIGEGGMGEVVSALDHQIGREVAIKRMRTGYEAADGVRRFMREAQIQGRLEHPAIVPVHELSIDAKGQPYFVMKKLAGETLASVLAAGTHSLQRLLRAFVDVCLAIEFAHTRGVIHRDLKPANIMLGDFGEVYVLDWGVARVRGQTDPALPPIDSANVPASEALGTVTGTLLGTPGFMAPEQIRGDATLDGRADVYSLGAILFEILAGEPLHPPGMIAIQTALAGIELRPSQRTDGRDIAPELDAIVERACALEPADRFATARELADRVTAYVDGDRDLLVRKQLAAAHLDRALHALAPANALDDEAARKLALREASSALALDPTLDEATRVVARLMLSPPRETPREVETALAERDTDVARRQARIGTYAILGYLAYIPVLLAIGVRDPAYMVVYVALVLAGAASTFAVSRSRSIGMPQIAAVLAGQVALVAFYARIFSPFLVAPGVAGAALMAIAQQPRFGRVSTLWAAMSAGVLVPFALERIGLLSRTMEFSHERLVLSSPALLVHELPSTICLSVYVPVMLFVAVYLTRQNALAQRDARRQIETQKWQLAQLMPS